MVKIALLLALAATAFADDSHRAADPPSVAKDARQVEEAPMPRVYLKTEELIQNLRGEFGVREAASADLRRRLPAELATLRKAYAKESDPEAARRLGDLIGPYEPVRFEKWSELVFALGELVGQSPLVKERAELLDRSFRTLDAETLAQLRAIEEQSNRLREEREKCTDGKRLVELIDKQMEVDKRAGTLVRERLSKVKVPDGLTLKNIGTLALPALHLQSEKPSALALGDALRARFGKLREGIILPDGSKLDEKALNDFQIQVSLLADSYAANYAPSFRWTHASGTPIVTSQTPYFALAHWLNGKYPNAKIDPRAFVQWPAPQVPAKHPTAGRPWKDPGPIN